MPVLERLLREVEVVDEIDWQPGYDRACDPGACVFGPAWTDDHDGVGGHNGCDTRQDVLLRQMRDIELRWGSECRIYEARLTDPYTGEELTWRDDGYWIAVDHVYPLARAWHGGAWAWSQRRRVAFANDVRRELLAVSAAVNDAKGAAGPAEWLPPRRASRCAYGRRYVAVAAQWDLPLTDEDVAAVRRAC
ncbi:deoxyribonuclease [Nocardioides gansuensis]|uniref:Deoxyribonuclease n=2 Tax=Nocardioides gansuensis TaxID=2138300 RepID=A0A2T8FG32_9ACTN|nr:deoxyribonuclease [Nocardioides gansuensis]